MSNQHTPTETDISQLSDPAIVVQAGGRLIQINDSARALFRLKTDETNLQQMSMLAQPEIEFLALFTKAGQIKLQIAGRDVEATSIPIANATTQQHLVLFHVTQATASGTGPLVEGKVKEQPSTALQPTVDLVSTLRLEPEDFDNRELVNKRLITYLAAQLDVEQCAILLHDKRRDIFRGIQPLHGLPEVVSDLYRFEIGVGDNTANCRNFVWYTNDLANSQALNWFNMRSLMNTVGIRNTALLSLASWGERLAAIQVSNKAKGALFTKSDILFLEQIAPSVAELFARVELKELRTSRVQDWIARQEIQFFLDKKLPVEDLLPKILQITSRRLNANGVAFLKLDNAKGCLSATGAHLYSDVQSLTPVQIDASVQEFHRTVTMTRLPFFTDDAANDTRILPFYRKYQIENNIRSIANMPVFNGDINLGELWVGSSSRYGISQDDEYFLRGVADDIASLYSVNTHKDESKQAMQQRIEQLSVLVRVSRQLNQTLDLDDVLDIIDLEARKVLGVFVVDVEMLDLDSMDWFDIPSTPHTAQLNSIEDFKRRVSLSSETVIVDRAVTPFEALDDVKAMMVAPIVNQDVTIGLITMFGESVSTFTPSVIEYIETLAAQASSALGNATRYEDQVERSQLLRTRADQLSQLLQISGAVRSDAPLKENLEQIAYGVQESAGFNTVIISVISPETGELQHMAAVGLPIATFNTMQSYSVPWMRVEELTMLPEYSISNSYLIRNDLAVRTALLGVEFSAGRHTDSNNVNAWNVGDLLFVPLSASTGENLGAMLLFDPLDHKVPAISTIQVMEIFANQAVLGIENTRLFTAAERRAVELESSLASLAEQERRVSELNENLNLIVRERTADLERERDLNATLLRINTELSSSLDLDDVLARGLQLVNQSLNGDQGILLQTDLATEQLIMRCSIGDVARLPRDNSIVFADEENGLISEIVASRQSVIIDNLADETRPIPLENIGDYKSLLAAPLSTGEEALGALIFLSRKENAFNNDQLQLVAAAANQVASAINNSALYSLIRDQAERLGSMLRTQQVESSKSRAILEAVADGVMVADQFGSVILFNRSAEHILQISRPQIISHPVDEFLGLYGAAGKNWVETIERWNRDTSNYQPGDFLVERLYLDDNRVVSVHLAPVIDKNGVFIGSVSLFRDITREVEVDRLKTEFVATVSHELRTPMTAIKGYVDLMLMGATGGLTDKQVEFLNTVKSNADRLKMLVEDLLDISRMESGKVKLNKEIIEVPVVIDEVVKNLHGRISSVGKPATVVTNVPETLPAMIGDKGRLVQVFTNLVDNAYAYSPEDCTITIKAHSTPGALQVDVTDTGIGLTQEEQNRIFDRFFRGEDSLVLGSAGTGLGLSIVQRLVEMHEGHIWASSEGRGHGSTFSVLFPTVEETGELVVAS